MSCIGVVKHGLHIFYNYNYYTCRYALAFIAVPILSKELEEFMNDWNSHRIRPVVGASSPGGIPDDLYDMPLLQGMQLMT